MNSLGRPKPFTCYFCNKNIENETQQGHITTCGSVLEPCSYKCGSYIQRSMKTRHLKECPNKPRQYPSTSTLDLNGTYRQNDFHGQNGTYGTNRTSLEKRREQRYSMDGSHLFLNNPQEDVFQLKSKLQSLEQLCKNLSQNLSVLKSNSSESFQVQQNMQMQTRLELDRVLYLMNEWKRVLESQVEHLKQELRPLEKTVNSFESTLQETKAKISTLETIRLDLNSQKESLLKEQIYNRETHTDLREGLKEIKDFFAQENAVVAAIWNDQKNDIETLKQTTGEMTKSLDEQKNKMSSVTFDLRAATQISSEASEKLEIQERQLSEMKKLISQFRLDLEILEDAGSKVSSTPGRLIWKITGFHAKLESAKENNTVLKGPIFYSHEYGYKIRLLAYLNGIKKWRGRNLIACIHVLSGEFDPLLRWPCNIEGKIILRDQTGSNSYSKFISAKRNSGDEENEDPQESSTQYIFIPHGTLMKNSYLKDDTVFIEIRINSKDVKMREETNL